ncbi:MAG: alpha-amylase [Desulfuromonadales bacterium]|nr:alpha-amylase [Desulfuromonadales bacterium]
MPDSLYKKAVNELLSANKGSYFPSPADWRDLWIYFLLVDRFNNPAAPPRFAEPCGTYQGGTFAGIKDRLKYMKDLGVGAIWISPVLMNPQWFKDYWGGYGIFDFLRIEPRFCSDPAAAANDPTVADREFRELVDSIHDEKMYVILDIVLNHMGDLFNYEGMRDSAPWNQNGEYSVYWRDGNGVPQGNWNDIGTIPTLPREAGVWPREFQHNDYFRRRGGYDENGDITKGDFDRLKELVTEYLIPETSLYPVRNILIRAYQYLIAKFDLDGFRIDTLQYVETDFSRVFGNSIREFALSIGKKNFFTFGEVWQDDDEAKIAQFVGTDTNKDDCIVGVDAAIDFPMRKRLVRTCKAQDPPNILAQELDARREALKRVVSSHGDASRFYVTCLDNHDLNERINCPGWSKQTRIALTCLMTMQGVPCVYYGTEQGLDGSGDKREYVRESLWRGPNAFSPSNQFYELIRDLSELRNQEPCLRYGRQYYRPCSGNGTDFGYSPYPGGVISFSRILNDREILVVVNTSTVQTSRLHVVVDSNLNGDGREWVVLFSSEPMPDLPEKTATHGANRTVQVSLKPMEAQVLG